jgi:hypothetical protein
MADDSQEAALLIGAVLGDSDSESLAWSRAIGELALQAIALSADVESPLRINAVFHVSGRMSSAGFTGVRTGRFSKQKSLLVVQAAIEKADARGKRNVLLSSLEEMLELAEAYAAKKKLASQLASLHDVLTKLGEM